MQEETAGMHSVTDTEASDGTLVDGPESGEEKSALGDLQAVAGAFNAAFESAVSELAYSRKVIGERSARIDELDEEISSIRCALEDEHEKGRRREAEHSRETGQLRQDIHDAESARELLQKKVRQQERSLEERSGEIGELFARIEEMKTSLEERNAAGVRAQEEFEDERRTLNAKLDELQGLYDEAEVTLKSQQHALEERNLELGSLRGQVDDLRAEVESRGALAARLEQQVAELQDKADTQAEAMRVQSDSHARDSEELNARVSAVSGELETLRTAHEDLEVHAHKLENLNQALHESSLSEKKVHKQQMDEKAIEIELLRSRLDSADEAPGHQPDSAAEAAGLRKTLHELEARLDDITAQNDELSKRAADSDRLMGLNERLRAALREARERITGSSGEPQEQLPLQAQVVDLQAALDAARSREQELAGKLQDHETLEQEVARLREAATGNDDGQSACEEANGKAAALEREVEQLRAALSVSEEKCRQLHTACSSTTGPDRSGVVLQVVPDRHQDTAAPGRARFIAQLDALLVEHDSSGEHHSLMYVLLDNFISIRDEIGVVESESVVSEVASIIESSCTAEDIMARFGDCTFAVLCRNATVEEAEEKAGAIRSAVEARIFEHGGRSIVTTTSIGVCSSRRNDADAKDFISRADLACEAARLSGGNKVIVSSAIADEMTIKGSDEGCKEMVRRTLEEKRIKTYYQPITSLREQSPNHFEVLIRLIDESGDMILPGEFFAMAEGAGYADAVDRFVIDNTMKVISESSDRQVKYFIKLTRQSVADSGLPAWVGQKIGEYRISPEQLVFEIAEHIMSSDLGNVATLSESLNEIGCQIAIEHYRLSTSLQHLMHVHTDYLKIDRSLVGSIENKGESLAKITGIMELAKNNNCVTIAEGVETPGCLAMLWELGVSMAQGYFIQAPAAVREYTDHDLTTDCPEGESTKAIFEVN